MAGNAGWGPGQLEGEIGNGDWLEVAPERDLLFGSDDQSKWDRAIALHAIEL